MNHLFFVTALFLLHSGGLLNGGMCEYTCMGHCATGHAACVYDGLMSNMYSRSVMRSHEYIFCVWPRVITLDAASQAQDAPTPDSGVHLKCIVFHVLIS